MNTFKLNILAADKTFYIGDAISLIIPTTEGQYGILAHHRNMIAATVPGKLKYVTPDGHEQIAAISSGLVKVEDNEVLVLAESAERPEEIDINRAKRDAAYAKEMLLHKQSIRDFHSAQSQIARALNRIPIKEEHDIH